VGEARDGVVEGARPRREGGEPGGARTGVVAGSLPRRSPRRTAWVASMAASPRWPVAKARSPRIARRRSLTSARVALDVSAATLASGFGAVPK
jgi:hypothetical protein